MAQLINGPRRWKHFVKSSADSIQDPIFLTFDLDFFPTPAKYPLSDGMNWDSLFKPSVANVKYSDVEWSAIDWLNTYRSEWTEGKQAGGHLQAAVDLLVELQSSPWYFQSVSGIDQLWKSYTRVKEGDKKIELTVNCLDSIKQPLLRLAEHYRRAVYDSDKLCYNLPDNLRTFNMVIKIYEIRDINNSRESLNPSGLDQSKNDASTHPYLEEGLHQMIYTLHRCEFDFSDIMSGPANSELKAYTTEKPFETFFKIKAGWVTEESEGSSSSDYQSLGIFAGVMESLEGRANRFMQSAIGIPQRIIGNVTNQFQTTIENGTLGKAYQNNDVGNIDKLFGRVPAVGPQSASSIGGKAYAGADNASSVEYDETIKKNSDVGTKAY